MKKLALFFSALLLILITNVIIAQTGPGGVGNATNNAIWLDGNIVTLGTSPNISTWNDQSGNGNNFTQATSTNQPSVVTYNGFRGVRFDGGDWLRTGGIAALNTNTNTQFIVYSGFSANHTGMLYEGGFAQSSQFFRTFRSNGNVRAWVLNNSGGIVDNITTQSSTFQIVNSVWDGNTQAYTSFKDGSLIGSKSGANGNPTGNFINTIGAATNNGFRFNGDMGEVIIYNTALNTAERNIVDNYLAAKFILTIANDLYSYDGLGTTHRNELIGIGQETDGNNLVAKGKGIVQLSAASLNNGAYILSGHNNISLSNTLTDVPATILGGSRIERTWRVGATGTLNPITVSFDVASLPLSAGSYYLLVESNNGIFNDGGVISYGPFADVGGVVTFSGVTLADGDYFTIATGNATAIQSIKTGFWDVASTWNCNCVPGVLDDVRISAGHTVAIRTTVSINDITIDGILNSQQVSNFNVKGDYTIGATGSVVHKTVLFSGSVTQNLTNNSATTASFPTLVINNAANVIVQAGQFSITNSVQIPQGTFQNLGGVVTLRSTATNTAVALNIVGNFSGNFVVQRYISSRNANWADLSAPVAGATLGDWDSDQTGTVPELFMSGVGGVSGNAGGFVSVVRWDAPTQAYIDITDTNYVLVPGEAVELFLGDDLTSFNAKTIDTYGTPNSGNVAVTVSNAFNLVGNPYQAWINWTSLTKPTLQSAYHIFNTTTGTFDTKTNGSIPPHQGFWVESIGSGTLTFTESAKNGSGSSAFFRTSTNDDDVSFPAIDDEAFMNIGEEPFEFTEVQLKVKSDINPYNHTLKLRMNNLASVNHDYHDGLFLPSRVLEAPSIITYSANSNKKLALSSFNFQDEITMPIAVEVGISGKYIIEAINFENLANDYAVMELTDTKTGKVYDLTAQKEISIIFDEFENGERFSLQLSNNKANASSSFISDVTIYKSNEITVIELDNEQSYTVSVYNALGQRIVEDQLVSNTDRVELLNASLAKGLVVIKVTSNNGEKVQKLIY